LQSGISFILSYEQRLLYYDRKKAAASVVKGHGSVRKTVSSKEFSDMKMKSLVFLAASAYLILIPAAVFAEIEQVKVTSIQGNAKVLRGGQSTALKSGDICQKDDTLVTEADSTLDISVNNLAGSRILGGSEIAVSETRQDNMRLKIQKGNIILNLDKLPKNSTFRVETPTAVAVARGTQFWGRVQELRPNNPTSSFAVREGIIDVMTLSTGQTVSLREGQALDIPKDLMGSLIPRQALGQEISAMEQASTIKTC
jgi:hypothetical protein